jgi:hypothetical protein
MRFGLDLTFQLGFQLRAWDAAKLVNIHIFYEMWGADFSSIKPGVERFSAEPQVCGVEIHLACGAGDSQRRSRRHQIRPNE